MSTYICPPNIPPCLCLYSISMPNCGHVADICPRASNFGQTLLFWFSPRIIYLENKGKLGMLFHFLRRPLSKMLQIRTTTLAYFFPYAPRMYSSFHKIVSIKIDTFLTLAHQIELLVPKIKNKGYSCSI